MTQSGVYGRPPAEMLRDGRMLIRASAIGSCRRELWYHAHGYERGDKMTPEALMILESGIALEPVIVEAMRRNGWTVNHTQQSQPVSLKIPLTENIRITGHHDATGIPPDGETPMVIEIKSRGEAAFTRWKTLGAERSHPESVEQAAVYTWALWREFRDVTISTMNVAERDWDYEIIPGERVRESLRKARDRLVDLPRATEPPDRDYGAGSWVCGRCPFLAECRPEMLVDLDVEDVTDGKAEISDEEAQAALQAYVTAREAIRGPEKQKDDAAALLKTWLRQRGQKTIAVPTLTESMKVTLVDRRNYSTDYKLLNAMLPPEEREKVVRENMSQYIRVT